MSYSYKKYDKERMARACAIALPVSTKQSVELCRFIRNRTVKKAKELLNGVAQLKTPVPFRRYIMDLGHKKKEAQWPPLYLILQFHYFSSFFFSMK